MTFLENLFGKRKTALANQVGRVTPMRAVVARVAPIDLIKSSSIADGRIPSPLGGERVRVRGEITPVIDIKRLRFMERSLFPSDLLTAHEPKIGRARHSCARRRRSCQPARPCSMPTRREEFWSAVALYR